MLIDTGGGGGRTKVTVAVALDAETAAETAVTVMVLLVGKMLGAVYTPEVEMVPVAAVPPVTPLTCQRTPVLTLPWTVAVKALVLPSVTEAVFGLMLTVTTEAVTFTVTPFPVMAPGLGWRTAKTKFPTVADPLTEMEVEET